MERTQTNRKAVPAHSGQAACGFDDLRREGPGHEVPADPGYSAAGGGAERAGRADRRRGFRLLQRLRRAVPDADVREAGEERASLQPLPHHGAVLADAAGAADGPQPPFGRHGVHHGDRHVGSGLQLGAARRTRRRWHDAEAQWLLDGAVRQVPRGAGLADEPDGSVRRVAHGRRRLRVLLRLPRRGDQPVRPGSLRGDDPRGSGEDAGGRLSPHRGHDRQGDRVGAPAEGAHARQAVLHVLRARGDARAAPRAEGMGGQVQGEVRPGLGQAA